MLSCHRPGIDYTTNMQAAIIHIGYHKTATSWFQKSFYPLVQNAVFMDRKRVRKAFLNTTAFKFDPDKAKQFLHVEGRPVICEEDLCGHFDNGGLLEALSKDVAYRLHAVYPDAQIVIFIRNQLDMIRSTYLQYVRTGGTWSLKRFLFPYEQDRVYAARWYKKPMLTLDHFAYRDLIGHYREVFGKSNVHVFCYEAFAADTHNFISDYARRFDLDFPVDRINYSRRNESLGMVSLQLARCLGPFTRWENPNRLKLLPVIPKWIPKAGLKMLNLTPLGGPRLTNSRLFGDRLCRQLQERFSEDNRILADQLNLPLSEYGYPLNSSEPGSGK